MNFFEQQDRSKRATQKLLGLFAGSVIFPGVSIYFAVMLNINFTSAKRVVFGDQICEPIASHSSLQSPAVDRLSAPPSLPTKPEVGISFSRSFSHGAALSCHSPFIWFDARVFFWTMLATSTVIGSASWLKIHQLRAGGAVIAVDLGGRRLLPETATFAERQLLNVVEEMAIAAGMSVPAVYLLEQELGINAFAAGYTIDDAVIGVTQGSLNAFTRDELQGVIAHEFSHILNGDMALNIRLTGLLYGVLWVHILGRIISTVGRGNDHVSSEWLFLMGLLVQFIGSSGLLSGRLIQSAISRQREFLADASAVQFTRNPDGIASALRRIDQESSFIHTPQAETSSHMFFSPALDFNLFNDLFATHPSIAARLKTIGGVGRKLGTKIIFNGAALPTIKAIAPIATSAELSLTEPAATSIDETLVPVAHLYTLLLDADRYPAQLTALAQWEEPAVIEQITTLWQADQAPRLATIDRHLNKIRETEHGARLLKSSYPIIALLPPENWRNSLAYLIIQHRLNPPSSQEIYHSIAEVGAEIRNVLGTLARQSHPPDSNTVFQGALLRLPATLAGTIPPALLWREFQTDLAKIACANSKVKQSAIAAGIEMLTSHRQTSIDGVDLMRSIAILLDCPVPPLLDHWGVTISKDRRSPNTQLI
jgi:Zn-dependent protease with chaperone function